MAVSAKLYYAAFTSLANKEIDWGSDTVKVMLCTSAYTPNQATHQYKSSVVASEVSGTGYSAGGVTLASKTEAFSSNTKQFDAGDVSWGPTATFTARYAVVYVDTGVAGTSALIGYVDFGQDVSPIASTLQITWDASGIFTITVS